MSVFFLNTIICFIIHSPGPQAHSPCSFPPILQRKNPNVSRFRMDRNILRRQRIADKDNRPGYRSTLQVQPSQSDPGTSETLNDSLVCWHPHFFGRKQTHLIFHNKAIFETSWENRIRPQGTGLLEAVLADQIVSAIENGRFTAARSGRFVSRGRHTIALRKIQMPMWTGCSNTWQHVSSR